MEPIVPELEGHHTAAPERRLIAEVLLLAVTDSLGGALLCGKGISKMEAASMARKWLISSPVCAHYCTLVDIDHRVMIERLQLKWRAYATI